MNANRAFKGTGTMEKKFRYGFDAVMIVLQIIIFAALILFVFPHSEDDKLIRGVKKDGMKYENARAVIWVENGFLDEKTIRELNGLIEKGIRQVEGYTGIRYDRSYYASEKINYYFKKGRFSSRIRSGNMLFRKPDIICSTALTKTAPYLPLTVKLIARKCEADWLKEGLALFLNEKFDGWHVWPLYNIKIDSKAREMFDETSPVKYFALELYKKIGENAAPQLEYGEYEIFIVMSASFVKYLDGHIGNGQLMEIYSSNNPKQAIQEITGKSIEIWKDEWFKAVIE